MNEEYIGNKVAAKNCLRNPTLIGRMVFPFLERYAKPLGLGAPFILLTLPLHVYYAETAYIEPLSNSCCLFSQSVSNPSDNLHLESQ